MRAAFLLAVARRERWQVLVLPLKHPRGGWHVVAQVYTSNNAYFKDWYKAVGECANALGIKWTKEVDEENNDKLISIYQTAASQHFNAITTEVADPGISRKILDIATSAKMYTSWGWNLAPWVSPFDVGQYFDSFITPNNIDGTRDTAETLFRKMGGRGELIHITGIPGNTVDIYRTKAVNLALKKFPNVKLVARQPGQFARGPTTPVINALLTAHPNVKGIMCQNDDSAIGVLTALRSKGLTVPVAGVDAIPEFVEAMIVDSGRAVATWTTSDGGGAWLGARLLVNVFDALSGYVRTPPERMMYAGGLILDSKPAANAYNNLMNKGGKFPFDYRLWSRALHPNDWDPQVTMAPIDYPAFFSVQTPMPKGYTVAPEWTAAKKSGQFAKVKAEYAAHIKKDPFASVRKLCVGGGRDII